MQLVIDIGNTRVKTGLFHGEELISNGVTDEEPVYAIKEYFDSPNEIEALIISSVRDSVDPDLIPIPETIHHVMFDHETELPIINKYESPKSLGLDRIALAVAAASLHPKQNVLVIDAGTCVTFDVVNRNGEYLGGIISPGIQLRLNAMHEGTSKLPQLKFDGKLGDKIGKSTEGCMKSGAVNGMLNEVMGTIKAMDGEFEDLKILLTGGDAQIFDNELKSGIFADPNLVLRGLNKILLHNIEKH